MQAYIKCLDTETQSWPLGLPRRWMFPPAGMWALCIQTKSGGAARARCGCRRGSSCQPLCPNWSFSASQPCRLSSPLLVRGERRGGRVRGASLTEVWGVRFIRGFVAAGMMLISDYPPLLHIFINTRIFSLMKSQDVLWFCCQICFWTRDATGDLLC